MTGHERLKALALADRAEADFPWSSCPMFLRSWIAQGWDDAALDTVEKSRHCMSSAKDTRKTGWPDRVKRRLPIFNGDLLHLFNPKGPPEGFK